MSRRGRKSWSQQYFSVKQLKSGSDLRPNQLQLSYVGGEYPNIDEEDFRAYIEHQNRVLFEAFALPYCVFHQECSHKPCKWHGRMNHCPPTKEQRRAIGGWQEESEDPLF